MATPAAAASATTRASSSSLNGPPPRFSVRYRLPKTSSRTRIAHAQESPHRRVPVREPGRPGVRGNIGEAQRLRIADQLTEQAAALRPVMDPGDLVLTEASGHESAQPPTLADDPERPVPGVHQGDRSLHDLPERGLQVQLAAHRDDGLQQRMVPVPRVDHRLQPPLELSQQVIEPQLRHQRMGFSGVQGWLPAMSALDPVIVCQPVQPAIRRTGRCMD